MTKIEWTNTTWNPVRGCSIVSKGCTNCYAMKQAHRFSGHGMPYEGLTQLTKGGPVWTGKVRTVPEVLDAPLRWKKPRRIFVNSMSDLFHEDVGWDFIDEVFGVMATAPQHTFQVLTKRPRRMLEFVASLSRTPSVRNGLVPWPLPNVWLGVSVEDQAAADERIPLLFQMPAAVRFLSMEPLLGPVDLEHLPSHSGIGRHLDALNNGGCQDADVSARIDWVIVGGESGPGARPFEIPWARSIVQQCKAADVAVFVKQLGAQPRKWCAARVYADPEDDKDCDDDYCDFYEAHEQNQPCPGRCAAMVSKKGGDMAEWPADLRVREFPT
jgi:protein gp37